MKLHPRPTETITVPIRSVDELLDSAGSPVLGPRIHPDVADAVWLGAQRKNRFESGADITFHVPVTDVSRCSEVEAAVRTHFRKEADHAAWELRENKRNGRISLVVGLVIVALTAVFSEWLARMGDGRIFTLLSESLVIIAWVTLWIPVESLLFAHFPIRRKQRIALQIAEARIQLVGDGHH